MFDDVFAYQRLLNYSRYRLDYRFGNPTCEPYVEPSLKSSWEFHI